MDEVIDNQNQFGTFTFTEAAGWCFVKGYPWSCHGFAWSIWKLRNAIIFAEKECNFTQVFTALKFLRYHN